MMINLIIVWNYRKLEGETELSVKPITQFPVTLKAEVRFFTAYFVLNVSSYQVLRILNSNNANVI